MSDEELARWKVKARIAISKDGKWTDEERARLVLAVEYIGTRPNMRTVKSRYKLTTKQSRILNLFLNGRTQSDIGRRMSVGQTTIHKTLWGNIDYAYDKAIYGGVFKKIGKKIMRGQS